MWYIPPQCQRALYLEHRKEKELLDLRSLIKSEKQLARAKELALRGLLSYQPYIFSDDFAVGNGLGNGLGLKHGYLGDAPAIYYPEALEGPSATEYAQRFVVDKSRKEEFFSTNDRLRNFYDAIIEGIVSETGSVQGATMLDVGCNSGYFPLSFAQRGAAQAVGLDRVDYSETIKLMNEICGTDVEFRAWSYDGSVEAKDKFDIVTSVAVLCHLSDPLQHLAWLGSSAKKAIAVFTPTHDDEDYSIQFKTVNRYYEDPFPYCFDMTTISKKLLRCAFEQMGFTRIVEIDDGGFMPKEWSSQHLGILGIRENIEYSRFEPRCRQIV